ncbi:hypothetical protein ISF_03499 [Cordyceps fumosorosea ARSEF 2679]|uniref:Myb/SANT-like domain-containing protein n=1 Tax=Cordyceps fumosorosea (strain ARSEF 2679) TaxID=1081104 RepID=A0A162LDM1_CORFA|nr:hypothetical protein ISF_03499 [Cordyceps fumosorosea ARSEF 2679]OAA69124.1 hypothetical protein ISF_03499 [Cordyceps fumosorosea ARSEF 2679]
MSEDDVDMLAADGQGPGKVDRDRRAPRFSWTPAYEATFFRSLCESVQLGLRENSSFKAEAWERAAQALQESHGASPTKNHLINKSDNARKRFRLWRGLREDPDFVYNPKARTVTATEEAWRAHIEREPLSRALRGRPFDHEDYMETLYPDVIGSGGAPKRIMKPKRRDGQLGDDSELAGPNASILSTDQAVTGQQSGVESPGTQSAVNAGSGSQPGATTPSSTVPTLATTQGSALTPPEDTAAPSKKRSLTGADLDGSLSAANTPSRLDTSSQTVSLEKRLRFSAPDDATANLSTSRTSRGADHASLDADGDQLSDGGAQEPQYQGAARGSGELWREKAVDLFYREFSAEELDLQVRIPQRLLGNDHTAMVFCKMPPQPSLLKTSRSAVCSWLHDTSSSSKSKLYLTTAAYHEPSRRPKQPPPLNSYTSGEDSAHHTIHFLVPLRLTTINMSYASAAAKGPKQSPSEAAAPPPPEIIPNESASTSSLIDVDMPSVHTVPSDFLEQDVQTETQANRLDREAHAARVKADRTRKEAAAKAKKADSWLAKQAAQLSDGAASGIALANLATFVGVGSYLGYKAWGLYQNGNLDGKTVGLGVSILAGVGAVHAVVGGYLYRGKKN